MDKERKKENKEHSGVLSNEQLQILSLCETDVDGALQRLNGNERLYEKCLRAFLEDPSMAQIRESIKNARWDDAFTAAHALKGVAGNMGFVPLMHTVGQLVVIIRGGRINEIREYLDTVEVSYREVIEGICKCIAVSGEEGRKEAI